MCGRYDGQAVRRELGGSGDSDNAGSKEKAPNLYQLQKQRKAEVRMLNNKVKQAEEQLQEYTAGKAELEAEMAADPRCAPTKTRRVTANSSSSFTKPKRIG